MNSSTKLIIGLAMILGNAMRSNLGFSIDFSSKSLAYNIFSLGIYLFGFYLIDRAFRSKTNTKTVRKTPGPPKPILKDKIKY